MITEQNYLAAKELVSNYERKKFDKYSIIGRFDSIEECASEASNFTKESCNAVKSLLSDDYILGYKEGIEHYLIEKNNLNAFNKFDTQSVLRTAVEALYFDDSSDYKTALYNIVSIVTGRHEIDEKDISYLYLVVNSKD